MKMIKHLLIGLLLINGSVNVEAQTDSLFNLNFSDFYFGGLDRLWGWGNSEGCAVGEPPAIIYNTHLEYFPNFNDYALRMQTISDTQGDAIPSFAFSSSVWFGTPNYRGCNREFIHTGHPYTHRPDALRGWYILKNDSIANDRASVAIILKKYNPITQTPDTIGYGRTLLPPTLTDSIFEAFECPVHFYSNDFPDSATIIITSTDEFAPASGGVLFIDSLAFGHTTSLQKNLGNNNDDHITLFPNPATDVLNIRLTKFAINSTTNHTMEVNIINTQGQLLRSQRVNGTQINISDLPKGVYLIKIRPLPISHKGWSKTCRFVKM